MPIVKSDAETERFNELLAPVQGGNITVHAERISAKPTAEPNQPETQKSPWVRRAVLAAVAAGLVGTLCVTVKGANVGMDGARGVSRTPRTTGVPPTTIDLSPDKEPSYLTEIQRENAIRVGQMAVESAETILFAAEYDRIKKETGKTDEQLAEDFQTMEIYYAAQEVIAIAREAAGNFDSSADQLAGN